MTTSSTPFYKEHAMSFWMFFILSICTCGLYTYYYHYKIRQSLKKHHLETKEISLFFTIFVASLPAMLVFAFLTVFASFFLTLYITAFLSFIISAKLYVWRVTEIIKEYVHKEYAILVVPNPVFVFFYPGMAVNDLFNVIDNSITYYRPNVLEDDVKLIEEKKSNH